MLIFRSLLILSALISVTAFSLPSAADNAPETQPLMVIMHDLGKQMNEIQNGLWRDDFARIERAGKAIADHPRVPPKERESIGEILGKDFASFVQTDRQTHAAAHDLAQAARDQDREGILEALARTQNTCVSCHVDYRERLGERVREGE